MITNTAYLLLGSNLGDRKKFLAQAIELLEYSTGKVTAISSLYNTEPWGQTDQNDFLNQALCIETAFSAINCLKTYCTLKKNSAEPEAKSGKQGSLT